ncbi:porin [Burkholderia contaminans]|uniref:porin n=1 Tax=Burkholderia contaminans TaxID=488447 RepID=UPI0015F9D4F1|nr:porin [Burkholderia contaminans]MBA9842455.1 porin [Burkholderia contaminans]MBX3872074.1 porin [Burkholderia contaminans]MCB4331445.1 porin [Burkholderia contaminans]
MRKAIALCAAAGFVSGTASAQSTVLLYGILDEGANYVSNAAGHHLYNLSSGVLNGSRWGLRVREDLGSGYGVIAVMENGFDVNTGKLGQGGLGFGRQAYVGLSSPYGTVTLGRQYDSVVDTLGLFEVGDQWGGSMAAHPSDNDNFNNTNRVNNAIKYTSPVFHGVTATALYSLGGVAGHTGRNQIWSAGVSYANGPLSLGAGYLNVRNPNTSFYGSGGTVAATVNEVPGSNFGASPVISGYASAHSLQVIGAGAAYTIGALTLGTTYSNTQFRHLGDTSSGPVPAGGIAGTAKFDNVEASVKYQFTPSFLIGAAYVYTRNSGADSKGGAHYNQASVGADYFLSKRTDVYLVGTYQRASGTYSTGRVAVASINQLTPSTSNHQTAIRVAIRHRF